MDAATAAAKSAAQEVEAAWAAAATAEAEMAEEHKRALGEESAKVYRVVRNDLRALRRRYFVRMGKDTSGAEIDVEDCDEDNDGVDMGRARKRLGIEGLVSAMMDFKRRGEVDADAFGDMGLRKELRGWRSVCFLRSPVTWKMARTRRSRRFKPKRRLRYANHRMWLKVSGLLGRNRGFQG